MAYRGGPLRSSASASVVPGWRVEDFHRLLTHFFEQGVVQGVGGELAVSERGAGANMSVDVASGLALIEVTSTLLSPNVTSKTWFYSDAVVNLPVPTADSTHPRKDRIVAVFDMTIDPNGSASNNLSIELIEGTPGSSPSLPSLPSNAIHLKTVNVAAGATSVVNANLADTPDSVTLQTDVLTDLVRTADLESDANGKGASLIKIEDAAGNFSGDTVEDALAELSGGVPTGTMLIWSTDTAPSGFLLCYGQAVSRSTYAALFSVISTKYGAGDGTTTFNLPDPNGRFMLGQDDAGGTSANRVTDSNADTIGGTGGAESVTLTTDQMPAHKHEGFENKISNSAGGAALIPTSGNTTGTWDSAVAPHTRTASAGGGQAHNNMPPYLTVNYIIKT